MRVLTTTKLNKKPAIGLSFYCLSLLMISFVAILPSVKVIGQSSANYVFATNTTGSLALDANSNAIDMTTGATLIVGPGLDASAGTGINNIGFEFYLMGNRFTQFSVQEDGLMQLGSASTVSTNTYSINGGTLTSPRLGAFNTDMRTGTTTGKISSKLIGTAPNRVLVVEFFDMQLFYTSTGTAGTSRFQIRLYESGVIEYVYGTMSVTDFTAINRAPSIGFYTGSATNSFASVLYASNSNSVTSPFAANPSISATGNITNLNSLADGSRRVYSFTPASATAPSALNFTAVTGSGMTLNWTDNSSNELGFAIYRSTDNINFTYVTTTAANAVSSVQSGLSFGTTYYWKVAALREGLSAFASNSQATPAGTISGTKTVGTGGNYTNLTLAFADINTNGLAGNLDLQLITGYPATAETYPIASSNTSAVGLYTIRLYPAVSGLSITSANTTGTFNLNNATNLIIDGRVGGTGSSNDLVISNSNAGANSYAIQFINDASNNAIRYCNIKSRNNSTTSGTIVFGTTSGANGNDNNTITLCNISDESAANTPLNGIYASGSTTTTAQYNDNNNITNNNIFNFFSAGSATNGILISTGNSGWTITGNSIYQTANRTYTSANTHTGINISSSTAGNNFTVSNNFIGGTAATAGGTAYTMLGTVNTLFRAITLNVAATTTSNVQGNTIANISFTTASSSSTLPGIFSGINIAAGLVNVGTTTGNTIGAATGIGSITLISTTSGSIATGIYATSGANLNIQNNNIGSISTNSAAAIGHTIQAISVAGAGSHTVSSNNIGSASTTNSIAAGTSAVTTATCTIVGILNAATGTPQNNNSNNIYNNTVFSSGTSSLLYGIQFTGSSTSVTINMNSNIIRNNSMVSGSFVGIYDNNSGASSTITMNINSNQVYSNTAVGTGATTIYGIRGGTDTYVYNNNQVYNLSITANAAAVASVIYGIYNAASPTNETISGNQVYNLSIAGASTSASHLIAGVYNSTAAGTRSVNGNTIYGLTFTNSSTGSVSIYGIYSALSSPNIFKNKIYDLAATNGAASFVGGIYLASGTTTTVYNNLVGNLTAAASGLTAPNPSVAGLYIASGPTTINAYYNTINISGSSSGGSFGTAAVYANTTPTTVNLRNNIFVNTATAGATGKTVAYQRSGSTLTNYVNTSNNNLFYAGTPGSSNYIYFDGTNNDQSIAAFKLRMSTRDQSSVSENPNFLSTTGSNANFLHINTATATQIEGGAATIATFTDDYDGDARNATTPDIGADEFAGIPADLSAPLISAITVAGSACDLTSRTVTATIADPSNVDNASFQPRIYFRKNGGTYVSAAGSLTSGTVASGSWTFTITYAAVGGAVAADVIDYFIVAQDALGNAGGNPATGLALTNVNNVTSNPTTALTYSIAYTFNGTYTVGAGGNFTTLTAAIAAYNAGCMSGPTVFSLTGTSYTEAAALTINANANASATNTLTIKPTQANTNISITGGSSSAVIILNGADYVTLNGSISSTANTICPSVSASRDLTITNTSTSTSSAVIWLQTTAGSDAATNNTIINCNVVGSGPTQTLVGIGSGSNTISSSSLGTGNNNNQYINNNISKIQYGIYSQGAAIGNKNTGTVINQNLVNTASPNNASKCGILVGFENNITISRNNISNISGASLTYAWGISLGLTATTTTTTTGNEVTNATITKNIIGSVRAASTYGVAGIMVASVATGTNLIANNMIADAMANGTSSDMGAGIYLGGGAGTTNVYYNTIQIASTLTGGGFSNFGLAINGSNPVVDFRNNIITNTGSNGANLNRAIGLAYSTFTNLTSNNNDLFVSGTGSAIGQTGTLSNSGGTNSTTLANWQTNSGKDAASINVNPVFASTTDLHLNISNTALDNVGTAVSVTDDIDCQTRPIVVAPDMGADEFTSVDLAAPVISAITVGGNACDLTSRTVTATIADISNVDNASFQPRIYFRKNGGSYVSAVGLLTTGTVASGSWTFTITYSAVGGVTAADVIDYFIVAQDVLGNAGGNPSAGLALTNVNTVTSNPTTPLTYSITYTLNGTYTVGSGGNFATLTAAIAAYNAGCMSGPTVFSLTGATYTEATALTINANANASATNTLTIKPTQANTNISITGGSSTAVIILNGADYITIDGSISNTANTVCPLSAASRNLTITNSSSNSSSAVVWLQTTAGGNAATNNSVINCNLVGNSNTTTLIGVGSGSATIGTTSLGTANNNNRYINNNISKTQVGIYSQGASAANKNTGTVVNQNTMNATVASGNNIQLGGVWTGFEDGIIISGNDIENLNGSAGTYAIALGLRSANSFTSLTGNEVTGADVSKNIIKNIVRNGDGTAIGISVSLIATAASAANTIANNIISDVRTTSATPSDFPAGILIGGGAQGSNKIYHNTITLTGVGASSSPCFGLAVGGSDPVLDIRNNIFVNKLTSSGNKYAMCFAYSTFLNLTSNYNDFFVTSGSGYFDIGTGSLSAATGVTRASWNTSTGKDGNSVNIDPVFTPDLHLSVVNSGLDNAGTGGLVTSDIDCETRNLTTPDIGADEFVSTAPVVINSVSASPSTTQCVATARTITANTTAGGTNITSVTLNYNFNGVAQTPITMTGGNVNANQTSNWTATIPAATPVNATVTWTVTVVDGVATRTSTGTSYADAPSLGATATASVSSSPICAGSPTSLSATANIPGQSITIGAGGTTLGAASTGGLTPFGQYYESEHSQYLIRASVLTASGLAAGNISAMTFNVSTKNSSNPFTSFTIKLGTTSATALSGLLSQTLTQVYQSATATSTGYSTVSGLNSFAFGIGAGSSSSFNWDGTSNILVDVCFDQDPGSTGSLYSNTDVVTATTQSYAATYSIWVDNGSYCGATTGTNTGSSNSLPVIKFSGTGVVAATAYSWSDGTNVVGTTNPLTVNPSITTTYTATLTVNGCPVVSSPVTVNVNALPVAPGANNSIQCGTAAPAAFVTSGQGSVNSNNMRWYSAQTGGTLLQTGGYTYTSTISSTTHFWVAETNGNCESARTEVIASVNPPDPVQASTNNNNPCTNTSTQLTATVTNGTNGNVYSYVWTASPAPGSGIPTSQNAGTGTFGSPAFTFVTPTSSGTYTYTVTATDGTLGCVTTSQVVVTAKALPVLNTPTAVPAIICQGESSTITATTNATIPGTVTLGTGTTTNTSTSFPAAPYANRDEGGNNEILVRASELTGLGLRAGNITSLGFNVTALNSSTVHKGYTIKIKQTNLTALTAVFDLTSMTTVFGPVDYQPVVGINTHVFSTPFNWDGTSNLLIDICFDNEPTSAGGTNFSFNASTTYTTTSYNSLVYYNADGVGANRDMCGAPAGATVSTSRPNMIFGGQVPGIGAGTLTYVWNPGNISGNATSVTPSATTVYTVTATDPATGCSNTATATVTVNPLPPAPSAADGTGQCGTALSDMSVSSNNTIDPQSPAFFKWYDAPTGGVLKQSGTSTTYNTVVSVTTTLYVSEVSANGCEGPRVAITTIVSDADPITVSASQVSVCPNQSTDISAAYTPEFNSYAVFELTASGGAASGVTGTVSLTPSATVPGTDPYTVIPTAAGTYTYTITAFDPDKGCTAVNTVTVTVKAPPAISNVTATPSTVCAGTTVTLSASSFGISSGSTTIGTQTTTLGASGIYRFGGGVGDYRHQLLFTATELNAAGLVAGNITAVKFNVTALGSGSANNYTIKLASTTATALTATFATGTFTNCYSAVTYTPVSGVNTHTFTTPFNWDGTSNLLVDICYNISSSSATNSTVAASTPAAVSNTRLLATTGACTAAGGATTNASRPLATFSGLVSGNQTASNNWVWNPGNVSGGTTGTATVTPSVTTVYTVTATNTLTGCTNTATTTVTVNPIPAAPSTNSPVTRCGPGSVTLTATGSGGTLKWYTIATGGTSVFTGASYTVSVPVGTATYYVEETSAAGCVGSRAAVTVTASTPPALVITPGGPITYCTGGSVTLNAASASSPTYTNFSWAPAAGLSATNTAIVTANPTTTTTYTVTADDGSPNGCINITTITITVNSNPTIVSVTATPATSCAGGAVTLTGGESTLGTGTIQNANNSTTNMPPYGNYYTGNRHQMLILASELSALGFTNGSQIGFIAFDVVSNTNTLGYNNFTIRMGHTSAAALTSTFLTDPTNLVYTIGNYNPVPGWNTHTFSTPFTWNGTSNIVVETYFSNCLSCSGTTCSGYGSGITYSVSAVVNQSSTPFVSHVYFYGDSDGCSPETQTTASSSGTASVRPNMRLGSFSWTWNPGSLSGATVIVNPTVTTTYTATLTNTASGCSAQAPVTVTVVPVTANATASPSTAVCPGTAVTLSSGGAGGGTVSYTWASTPSGTYNSTSSITVNPTVTTTYTVTVKDGCNNTATSSVTVTVNPVPTASIQEGPGPINVCSPGTQVLHAVTDAVSASYQWTLDGVNIQGATASTYTVSGIGTGAYRVIITNTSTNCVSAASAPVTVTINFTPAGAVASANLSTICNGASVNLSANAATPPAVIFSENFNSITAGNTTSGILPAGWVGASLTSGTRLWGVVSSAQSGSTIGTGNFLYCESDGYSSFRTRSEVITPAFSAVGYSAASIKFKQYYNDVLSGSSTDSARVYVSNDGGNTYTLVQAYDSDQGTAFSTAGQVTANIPISIALTANMRVKLLYNSDAGGNDWYWAIDDFSVEGTPAVYTYSWTSNPAGFTSAAQNPTGVTPSTTTTYSVSVSTAAGCSTTASTVVTVNPRPTGVISGSGTYCNGQSTTTALSIAVTGAGPWSGTLLPGNIPFSGSTSPISVNVTPSATTTYTLATLNGSQCSAIAADLSGSATVTINPRPTGILSGGATYCNGQSTITSLSIAVTGAGPWSGTLSNGTAFSGSTSPISVSVTPSATTTYTIATLNGSQCSAIAADLSGSAIVTVNPRPTATLSGSGTYCNGQSTTTTLSIAVTGAGPWSGTLLPGNIPFSGTTSPISVSVTPSATTTYTVATLNGSQCSAIAADLSGSATVTINPRPTGTLSGSGTYCNGQSTTTALSIAVTGAGPWSGTLSDGTAFSGTTSPISVNVTPSATTTYTIATLNGSQCSAIAADLSGSATVTINPRPTGVISGSGTYCNGQSTTTSLSIAVTGAGPWSGTLLPGNIPFSGTSSPISVSVTPSATTTYTIATLNGSQCSAIAADLSGSATVTVNSRPTGILNGGATYCNGANTTTSLSIAVTGAGPWSGTLLPGNIPFSGSTSPISVNVTPSATTTYTIATLNGSQCSATAADLSGNATVTINPRPTATISGSGAFCQGAANTSTNLTVNFTGTAPWNYTYQVNNGSPVSGTTSSNPLTITVAPSSATAGLFTYTISALSDALCTATDGDWSGSGTVTINPLAATPTATVTQPTCALGTGSITMTAPLGTGNSYTLDGTTTITWPTITFTGVAPGPHTITVSNSFGCSAPASASVTVNPQPFTPTAPVVTGTVNICPHIGTGEQITYTATANGNGNMSFSWTLPPNVNVVSGLGTGTLVVTFPSAAIITQANKQIRVTATNQCGTSTMTIFYLLTQQPNTPNPISGPTDVCPLLGNAAGADYVINKAPGALSYLWSAQQSANVTITHPNGTGVNDTIIHVVFATGFTTSNITVQAVNDCGTSGARSLTVYRITPSTPGLIAGPTNACEFTAPNGTAATYSVAATPGVTYTWTVPSGATGLTGQGTNTISFTYPAGFTSGTVSVTATNGCGGPSAPRSLSITKLNPATPSVMDLVQTHFCGEAPIGNSRVYTYTLASMPANATSVLWTVPTAQGAVLEAGQGSTSITVRYPDAAVNGVVTAQAVNNCGTSTIRSTVVKLPACPVGFTKVEQPANSNVQPKVKTVAPVAVAGASMEVKIFPNPTVSDFKLEVLTPGKEEINVRVIDAQGRMYKSFKLMPYQTIALGAELKAGSYLVEVRQGRTVKTTKVIKF